MLFFYWGVEYVASFIEIMMCCIFCGTFTNKEEIKEKKLLIIGLSFLQAFLTVILNHIDLFSYVLAVFLCIMYIFIQRVIYKEKIIRLIVMIVMYIALLSSLDGLVGYFVSSISGMEMKILINEQSVMRVVCILLGKSLLIFLVTTINKVCGKRNNIPSKYIIIMFLCSVFLSITNIIMVNTFFSNKVINNEIFSMVFYLVTLGIELLIFYLLISLTEKYEQQRIMELVELKNKMLQKSLDDTVYAFSLWRKSVHDYKHNIISLTQLAEEGNLDKIKEYLKHQNELVNMQMFYIKTGNSMVDAMVNTKSKVAERKNIIFVVNAHISAACNIDGMDIANVLGNVIDNAIEASEKEKDAFIDISIHEEKKFLMITIKNKFTGKIQKNMATTKDDNRFHGIGMESVKDQVEKYRGQINYKHVKDIFTVEIMLRKE